MKTYTLQVRVSEDELEAFRAKGRAPVSILEGITLCLAKATGVPATGRYGRLRRCEYCEMPFVFIRHNEKYCTDRCRMRARDYRKGEKRKLAKEAELHRDRIEPE